MNDDRYLSGTISGHLSAGEPAVLVSIISMEGSTPRGSGTKMVVGADGKSYGTVGGSLLEANAITESHNVLAKQKSALMYFNLEGTDTSSDGMICGGKAVLLLDFIPPTNENQELFKQMYNTISNGRSFYFITAFTESGETMNITGHCLLFPDGNTSGDCPLAEPEITDLQAELHNISSTTILSIGGKKYVIDPVGNIKTLYCFGAGHVAQPTARIAAMCGFEVVVIDDREEFANTERFPEASHICVIEDFRHALDGLKIDRDSFIVIVTRGHTYDRIVLEQALKTDAGYIGMISSRTKRDSIFKALINAGTASAKDLERVHSPIGLDIDAETPEEIAVSIIAELIQERAIQRK
jgi:xanthine dehydrogenase accessory factor